MDLYEFRDLSNTVLLSFLAWYNYLPLHRNQHRSFGVNPLSHQQRKKEANRHRATRRASDSGGNFHEAGRMPFNYGKNELGANFYELWHKTICNAVQNIANIVLYLTHILTTSFQNTFLSKHKNNAKKTGLPLTSLLLTTSQNQGIAMPIRPSS